MCSNERFPPSLKLSSAAAMAADKQIISSEPEEALLGGQPPKEKEDVYFLWCACAVFVVRLRSASLSGRAWFAFSRRIKDSSTPPRPWGVGESSARHRLIPRVARGAIRPARTLIGSTLPLRSIASPVRPGTRGDRRLLSSMGVFLLFWDSF